jgi:hypothetical protein
MRRTLLTVCVFIAITAFTFGDALRNPDLIFHGEDVLKSNAYTVSYAVSEIKSGRMPWWNPYQFSGMPLVEGMDNFWYPGNVLFLVLPVPFAFTAFVSLHILLAMLGARFACRSLFPNASGVGWAVSGIVYGLSGFLMGRVFAGHYTVVASAAWLPWVFGSFVRLCRKPTRRSIVLAAVCLGTQLLAGYLTVALFTMEFVGAYVVAAAVARRSLRAILPFAAAVLMAIAIAAVTIVPNQAYIRQAARSAGLGYDWASYGSIVPASFREAVDGFAYGHPDHYAGTPPNYHEQSMFLGLSTVLLMTVGLGVTIYLFFRKRYASSIREETWTSVFLAAAIVAAGWVSLGPNAPLDLQKLLWDLFPFYRIIRIPPRHLILVMAAASFLAGHAVGMLKKRQFALLAAIAVSIELTVYARQLISITSPAQTLTDMALVARLKTGGRTRLLQDYPYYQSASDPLDLDAPQQYGIYSVGGYNPLPLASYYSFLDATNGETASTFRYNEVQIPAISPNSVAIPYLGVSAVMVPAGADPFAESGNRLFSAVPDRSGSAYRLYTYDRPKPRFFLAGNTLLVPSGREAYETVRSAAVTILDTVVIADKTAARPPACDVSAGTVLIRSFAPSRIVVDVTAPCDAYLSSSEVWYPGWRATVDGKPARVFAGNLAFRTVFVPKGKHTVELFYIPVVVYVSLGVTAAALLIAVIVLYTGTKKSVVSP